MLSLDEFWTFWTHRSVQMTGELVRTGLGGFPDLRGTIMTAALGLTLIHSATFRTSTALVPNEFYVLASRVFVAFWLVTLLPNWAIHGNSRLIRIPKVH